MENLINDIPVIKTFVYNGSYYLYDTYTNQTFSITKRHYMELQKLQRIGIFAYKQLKESNKEYDDILLLMEKGLLKYNFISKIKHQETNNVEHILDNCITSVILQVTQDCNFRCRYCSYATTNPLRRKHNSNIMSWQIAQKAIDFLYEHSSNAPEIKIYFYGGEPLLNYQLIVKVVNYINEKFFTKKIKYSMTVNGSILTDEMLEFFIRNNFYISISFDGDKTTQNRHRRFLTSGRGTFDVVYNNIEKIREKDPVFFYNNISIMPVIFGDEDDSLVKNFFQNLGIQRLNILKANLNGIDYKMSSYKINIMKEKEENHNQNGIIDETVKRIDNAFFETNKIPPIWHHNGPCIGAANRLFIDISGNFYPCEKVPEEKALIIGNIHSGLDLCKIKRFLNVGLLTKNECINCWAMRFCNLCIEHCYDLDSDDIIAERKKIYCDAQRRMAKSSLKMIIDQQTEAKQSG